LRIDENSFDIEVKYANDDTQYRPCNKQHNLDTFKPYIGLVATNKENLNEIDINAIFITNNDPRVYRDVNALE
jgi:hypothetical protein